MGGPHYEVSSFDPGFIGDNIAYGSHGPTNVKHAPFFRKRFKKSLQSPEDPD